MKIQTNATAKKWLRQRLMLLSAIVLICGNAYAQTTAFTYQGKLVDSGNPANGSYDFQFKLFDTVAVGTGTQQGSTVTVPNVSVSNGIFTVQLDFGVCASCFDGSARFLEIAVKPTSSDTFTTLSPRQPITSTPYAINAANAAQLGGLAASGYLQNSTSQQASSNFNISGNGTAGGTLTGSILNAVTQVNINGLRAFTVNGAINTGTYIFTASNTFAGDGAGVNTTPDPNLPGIAGKLNSFYGAGAGLQNTTGSFNSFFGFRAGFSNTLNSQNTFFGSIAGETSTGSGNSFFGHGAGGTTTTGNFNSFFGWAAGNQNTTGSSNTAIGENAGFLSGILDHATVIGANASVSTSNSIVLGRSADKVGIGVTAPTFKLHVIDAGNTGLRVETDTTGGTVASFGGSGDFQVDAVNVAGGRLIVKQAGNVGIGTNAPNDKLEVNGIIRLATLGGAGSTQLCRNASNQISTCSSSLRYKTNIAAFSSGLSLIKQLHPITFDWKADGRRDVGFGAEDVARVNPLFVTYNQKGEVEGVKYDRLSVVFVNAFKEQQAQLKERERQAAQQQEELEQVRRQLAAQQERSAQQQAYILRQQARFTAQQSEIVALRRLLCRRYPKEAVCKATKLNKLQP